MLKTLILLVGTAVIVAGAVDLDGINKEGPQRCESHYDTAIMQDGRDHWVQSTQCWGALGLPTGSHIKAM